MKRRNVMQTCVKTLHKLAALSMGSACMWHYHQPPVPKALRR